MIESVKFCLRCKEQFDPKRYDQKFCPVKCRLTLSVENGNVTRIALLRRYGLSLEDYNELLKQQGGVYKICEKPEIAFSKRHNKIYQLSIDHDHVTGKIRGLLCHACNKMLGIIDDDPVILLKAIHYLKSSA